jgi:hypothetical protein
MEQIRGRRKHGNIIPIQEKGQAVQKSLKKPDELRSGTYAVNMRMPHHTTITPTGAL